MDHLQGTMVDLETIAGVFGSIETTFVVPPEIDIFIIRIILIQRHYKGC